MNLNVVGWNTNGNIMLSFADDGIVLSEKSGKVHFSKVDVAILPEFGNKPSNIYEGDRVRYLQRSTPSNPGRKNLVIAVAFGVLTVEVQNLESGYLCCKWVTKSHTILLAGIHSQEPNYFKSVMTMHRELDKYFQIQPSIVAGDFNLNADLVVRGNSRTNFQKFWELFRNNFDSAYHVANQKSPDSNDIPTLHGYSNNRMIDYVFFSRSQFTLIDAFVGETFKPSNHYPIFASLKSTG